MKSNMKIANWLLAGTAAVFLLAGCGGGGGSSEAAAPPPPPADVRNGEYTAFAADGYPYALNLDFDAKTYSVVGGSVNATGTFVAEGSKYVFQPTPAGAAQNTAKFTIANDTVIGGFKFGANVIPFVAPRKFVTTLADAVGTYNFLSTLVDPTAPPENSIFSGEVTAAGQLRTCNDSTIYTIALCPSASVVNGTVTVSGSDFAAATAAGTVRFRVAVIGSDKVFLRASASTGTSRRFTVGTAPVAYTAGTFSVVDTLGRAGTTSASPTAYSSALVTPAGATVNTTGTATAITPTGLLAVTTTDVGNLFAIRAGDIGVVVAARGNTQVPGLVQIGRP